VEPDGGLPDGELIGRLTRVLTRACRSLADAGRPHEAGRLAADGWVLLRKGHPAEAERLNGAMHYTARLEQKLEQEQAKGERMPAEDRELDVREEVPKRRHELIFETFDALEPGTGFVLVNDHDPKPLYYQFAAEHAGEFSWDPIEEGPEAWRVRIGRTASS